jgi:hypothetical protein
MRWQSPKNKLLLASALLGVLLLLAPGHGVSPATVARNALGLGALAGLAFWAQRKGQGASKFQLPGRLTVAARTGLSPKCAVALVEADGRTYLVAYGDGFAEIQETVAAAPRPLRQARKAKPLTRRASAGASRKAVAR